MNTIMYNLLQACASSFETTPSGIQSNIRQNNTDGRLAFCLLCDFEGIGRNEFSKLLNISQSAVSQNIIRAKERLETHPEFRTKIEKTLASYQPE